MSKSPELQSLMWPALLSLFSICGLSTLYFIATNNIDRDISTLLNQTHTPTFTPTLLAEQLGTLIVEPLQTKFPNQSFNPQDQSAPGSWEYLDHTPTPLAIEIPGLDGQSITSTPTPNLITFDPNLLDLATCPQDEHKPKGVAIQVTSGNIVREPICFDVQTDEITGVTTAGVNFFPSPGTTYFKVPLDLPHVCQFDVSVTADDQLTGNLDFSEPFQGYDVEGIATFTQTFYPYNSVITYMSGAISNNTSGVASGLWFTVTPSEDCLSQ